MSDSLSLSLVNECPEEDRSAGTKEKKDMHRDPRAKLALQESHACDHRKANLFSITCMIHRLTNRIFILFVVGDSLTYRKEKEFPTAIILDFWNSFSITSNMEYFSYL